MDFIMFTFVFVGLVILFSSFFTVKQQTSAIVERFGKFQSIRHSGLQLKIPIVDKIAGKINLKIQQLDVIIETKTKENVFVKMKVSVQFKVIQDKVYEAFYKLEYPHDQITSYVFDVVRAEVPKLKLDDVFERKDDIAIAVKRELNEAMTTYGYTIINTLVTDIDPDIQVKNAMNRINAADREKTAAEFDRAAPLNPVNDTKLNRVVNYRERVILQRPFSEKHYWLPLNRLIYLDRLIAGQLLHQKTLLQFQCLWL